MNKKLLLILLSGLFFNVFLSSCGKTDKAFSEDEKKIIDSLYRVKLNKSKSKLDSICDSVYQAQFPIFIDSIKKLRKKEILDLITE